MSCDLSSISTVGAFCLLISNVISQSLLLHFSRRILFFFFFFLSGGKESNSNHYKLKIRNILNIESKSSF